MEQEIVDQWRSIVVSDQMVTIAAGLNALTGPEFGNMTLGVGLRQSKKLKIEKQSI
jgi:hypothetical protein